MPDWPFPPPLFEFPNKSAPRGEDSEDWLARLLRGVGGSGPCLSDYVQPAHRQRFSNELTRRANHRHKFIIAKILIARAEKSAAGFFVGYSNPTAAPRHDATSPHALLGVVSAPPSEPF
jgi:hypothetical protein